MKPFQRGYYQREKEKRKVFLTPLLSLPGYGSFVILFL
jgi:hypothetical protein